MSSQGSLFAALMIPGLFGLYALIFMAGGFYYLEQRVARIRDQFPHRAPLSLLIGIAALGIGLLTMLATAGYLLNGSIDFKLAILVATLAGVGFWIYHIYFDQTPLSRIRDGALAFVCLALVAVAVWWIGSGGR